VFLGVSWSLCDEWYGAALSQNSEKKQARKSCEQKTSEEREKKREKKAKGWKNAVYCVR
jgi:ribosome assembly protein YihI (activator of Der GTPase)